jgi:hypothetical protein
MGVLWRALRRRFYLVIALGVLTGAATYLVAQRVGETYEATGTVLVFPPSRTEGPTGEMSKENPYLSLGGVGQARDVVVRALTSKQVGDAFGAAYPAGTTFEIVPDYTNSAPIILFTVEASTPDVATDALTSLMDRVPVELDKLQAGLDLPPAERVSSVVLTRDEEPATTWKDMIRAALVTAAGLGGTGLLLIALVDGWLAGRREPDPDAAEEVADDDPPEQPAPVSLRPVPVPDDTPPDESPPDDGSDDDGSDDEPAADPPAPAAVTARLLRRRPPQDERGEAS